MTATRRALLRWADTKDRSWTLADCAQATRPDAPPDLARHAIRQVLNGLIQLELVRCAGVRDKFGSKTYEITLEGHEVVRKEIKK